MNKKEEEFLNVLRQIDYYGRHFASREDALKDPVEGSIFGFPFMSGCVKVDIKYLPKLRPNIAKREVLARGY